MLVIVQNGKRVVNSDNIELFEIVKVNADFLIYADEYEIGEYETEEDAKIALDKIVAGIQGGAKIIKMPPYNTAKEGL